MQIETYATFRVLGRIEDTFTDERKQNIPYFQLILRQGNGAETVTCTKDVYDCVSEMESYVFLVRVDTRSSNRLRIMNVGTSLTSDGVKMDFSPVMPFDAPAGQETPASEEQSATVKTVKKSK